MNTTVDPSKDISGETPEPEISLYDLIEFVRQNGHRLLYGLFFGFMLGGGGTLMLGKYRAEIVLDNSVTSQSLISYSEWNSLINALPAIATQFFDRERLEGRDLKSYLFLTRSKWWSTHVKTVLAVDKNTAKELGSMPENMKGDLGRILQVRIGAEAREKDRSLERAHWALDFLRNAGICLKINSLLDGYRIESIQARDGFAAQRVTNDIEVAYLQKDLLNLQSLINFNAREITDRVALMNRVVNESSVQGTSAKSVFNIRGGETPEIPLDARLNELKLQLYAKEIDRLKILDGEAKNQVLDTFLSKAEPLRAGSTVMTGEALLKSLQDAEAELRNQIPPDDLVRLAKLNQIRSNLSGIQLQLVNQLRVISETTEWESKVVMGALGGGFGGFFLVLLGCWLMANYEAGALKAKATRALPYRVF